MEHRRAPNFGLEPDQMLLERFLLRRCLRAEGPSHLWSALDVKLDAEAILRVYVGPRADDGALREAIRRDARQNRGVQHSHVARIHDVHEASGIVVTAVDGHDGDLLSDVLARDGARPYQDVLAGLRPLVEGLLHVHERGGEHGRLNADHLLAVDEARWILLPPDGTRPARPDLPQLGHLVAALLTGGIGTDEGRDLNDAAERLHGGRTVPALLNQLVNDLQTPNAALRPAGMRAVLTRLDEIDQFLDAGEVAAPPAATIASVPAVAPPGIPPPSTPTPGGAAAGPAARPADPGRRVAMPLMAAVVVVALAAVTLAVVAVVRTLPASPTPEPEPEPAAEVVTVEPEADVIPDPAAAEAARLEAARLAEARAGAELVLGRALAARGAADAIGAADWSGAAYESAALAAADADQQFLAQEYDAAARGYEAAAQGFEQVTAGKDEALEQLLAAGANALAEPDAARATTAFESALRIDPANEPAQIGRGRAATLDELTRLLASGGAHEEAGALDFAYTDYASASKLDPNSERAAAAYRRIKDRLADAEFEAMMARGLEAYHRGAFADARARVLEAQRFRPEAVEAAAALEMIEEAELREEVVRLREQGRLQETREQWQAAWTTYRQVLAIDAAVAFAQDGKARCETMISLDKQARHFLSNPELLMQPDSRNDAARLVQELEATAGLGPQLLGLRERLAEQVRLATTPLRVALRSDEETEVAVYRVGRFGKFSSTELELLPGDYTVVGQRKGYKDVRLTLRVRPGDDIAALHVVCTEPI